MSTEWYYAVEGTSVGPVSAQEFDRLVVVGSIRSDTLVWQEGMEDWLPYGRADLSQAAQATKPRVAMGDMHDPARGDASSFLGALKGGFARYVDFRTRSNRPQFWWWVLWSLIISIGAGVVDALISVGDVELVGVVTSLAMFLPSIAIAVRRLHDTGRSGWWYLLIFLPVVGWIALIVFFCLRSQPQENPWGPRPQR